MTRTEWYAVSARPDSVTSVGTGTFSSSQIDLIVYTMSFAYSWTV